MTRTPVPPAGARLAPQAQHITGGLSFFCTIGRRADFFKKYGPEVFPPGRLSVNLPRLTVQSHPLHPGGVGQIGPLPALAGEKEDLLLLGELHQQV